jgi:hypothetical protein
MGVGWVLRVWVSCRGPWAWAWVSWARDTRHARGGVKGSEAIRKVKYDYIPEELATDRGDALEARW